MRRTALLCFAVSLVAAQPVAAELPPPAELRVWIDDMKHSERGPFQRIRWFCNDGSVLPPTPYACKDNGGGSQHGEWSERTQQLRDGGFQVATIYADLDEKALFASDDYRERLAQMLIEQFLV